MADIDNLNIKITSSVESAKKSIESLAKSAEKAGDSFDKSAKRAGIMTSNISKALHGGGESISDWCNRLNSTEGAMKKVEQAGQRMAQSVTASNAKAKQSMDAYKDAIKDLGKNKVLPTSMVGVNQELKKAETKLQSLKDKFEILDVSPKHKGNAAWYKTRAEIEQTTNYIDALKSKYKELEEAENKRWEAVKAQHEAEENAKKAKAFDAENASPEEILAYMKTLDKKSNETAEILENNANRMSESMGKTSLAAQKELDELNASWNKTEQSINNTGNKLQTAGMSFEPTQLTSMTQYTKEYKKLIKDIETAENRLSNFLTTEERLKNSGVDPNSVRYKEVGDKIEQADRKLYKLYQDAQLFKDSGKDIELKSDFVGNIEKAAKSMLNFVRTSKLAKAATKSIKEVGKASIALAGAPTKAALTLAKSVATIGMSGGKSYTAIGKFIRRVINIFKSRLLRKAITQAFEYAKKGFQDLNQYSKNIGSPFSKNIQLMVSDLQYLGRSIAAAFEPIINVAAPILDFLVQKLVTVINYINQFFSALFGKETWTKATYGAEGYADATNKANKAQKDLNKSIREWDKLNVITDPNKNKGNGGSGSGGVSGSDPFTTEEVSSPIANLAQKFKETWETTADFTWLGADIALKVTEGLNAIPWDSIKKSAEKVGKGIATLINGFVEFPNMGTTIGTSLAEAINTAINGLSGFVNNIHGDSIGTFIADAVKSGIDNIEWDKYISGMGKLGEELAKFVNSLAEGNTLASLAKGFANLIKGGIEGAYQFITGINWTNLGKKIEEAIQTFFDTMNEVDPKTGLTAIQKAAKTFSDAFMGIFTSLNEALDDDKTWDDLGKAIVDAIEAIDWEGLFKAATKLVTNIAKGFATVFKKLSESKVIKDAIGDLAVIIIGLIAAELVAKSVFSAFTGFATQLATALAGAVGVSSLGTSVGAAILTAIGGYFAGKKLAEWLDQNSSSWREFWTATGDFIVNVEAKVDEVKSESNVLNWWNSLNQWWSSGKNKRDTGKQVGVLVATVQLGTKASDLWESFKKDWGKKSLNFSVKRATSAVTLWNKFKKDWGNAGSNLLTFGVKLNTDVYNLWKNFKKDWKKASTNFTIDATVNVVKFVNATKNVADSVWNALFKAQGGMCQGGSWHPIQAYEGGGFPNQGQLFLAREAGPELVGNLGSGGTAVMNNDQIVSSVANGVTTGVVRALSGQNQLLRQQNQLLAGILDKSGISYKDIGKATKQYNSEYKSMNGVSAFI